MKPVSCKAKGRTLQQWVCKQISSKFKVPYQQDDDQCLIHSREMGQSGVDVILRGDLYKKFPFDIECKNTERLNLWETIKQAKANAKPDRNWMIVAKKNRVEPIVVISWDAFINLIKGGQL